MVTPPRVSVGLPVFNGAATVERAIASIRAQTLEDFELIVSDNASSDDTEAICRRHAAADARIHYTRQSPALSGFDNCLLYTSPSPRDLSTSRMPSSA